MDCGLMGVEFAGPLGVAILGCGGVAWRKPGIVRLCLKEVVEEEEGLARLFDERSCGKAASASWGEKRWVA